MGIFSFMAFRSCAFIGAISLLVGASSARIYKCVDPTTTAINFTQFAREGCTEVGTGAVCDAACDLAVRKQEQEEAQRKVLRATKLNRQYPGSCGFPADKAPICSPRVGMRVDENASLLGLNRSGYVEDAKGKLDRWENEKCIVMASPKGIILSVRCAD